MGWWLGRYWWHVHAGLQRTLGGFIVGVTERLAIGFAEPVGVGLTVEQRQSVTLAERVAITEFVDLAQRVPVRVAESVKLCLAFGITERQHVAEQLDFTLTKSERVAKPIVIGIVVAESLRVAIAVLEYFQEPEPFCESEPVVIAEPVSVSWSGTRRSNVRGLSGSRDAG